MINITYKSIILLCSFFLFFFLGAKSQMSADVSKNGVMFNEQTNIANINSACISDELTLDDIRKLIAEKKPFFITGESMALQRDGDIPSDLMLINDLEILNIKNSLSSVLLIDEFESETGLMMCPAGKRMAVYPIAMNGEGVLLGTRHPKPGVEYYKLESYQLTDMVLIDANNAIINKEIFQVPIEMRRASTYPFFALTGFFNLVSNENLLKCFVKNKLNNYVWIDEFVQDDYVNKYCRKLAMNESNRAYLNQLKNSVYYIDYLVKFDKYSFEKNSYQCKLIMPLNYSDNLKNFSSGIELKGASSYGIEVEESVFNTPLPDIRDIDLSRIPDNFDKDYGYDNKRNYYYTEYELEQYHFPNVYQWKDLEISMTPTKAREIANGFNASRISTVRIYLTPRLPNTSGNKSCYMINSLKASFNIGNNEVLGNSVGYHLPPPPPPPPAPGVLGNSQEDEDKIFTKIEIDASFPGWQNFVRNNLKAELPGENGAPPGQYTVVVNFTVYKDGSITNVYAESDPGYGMAQEAVRVIKIANKWTPGIQNGKPVISIKRQPITWVVSE